MALAVPRSSQRTMTIERPGSASGRMPTPILLTSASARQYAFSLLSRELQQPQHPAPPTLAVSPQQSSSSASSTMSSTSETSNSAPSPPGNGIHPTGRKILVKFAPLPDPRKLEEDELDDYSNSDNQDGIYDDTRSGGGGWAGGALGLLRVSSSSSAAPGTSSSATPLDDGASTGYGGEQSWNDDPSRSPKSSPRWSTKRLLRPLLPKSSNANASSDANGAWGSPLFRPSSIDSVRSTQSTSSNTGGARSTLAKFGSKLGNRSASDLEHRVRKGSASSPSPLLARMSPLTHSISESGARSSMTRASSSTGLSRITSNSNNELRRTRSNSSNTAATKPAKRFMFNGRVYGSKRGGLTQDPFQHQRSDEQEFVEWGSGGVGSVPASRAQGAAADWHRVQAGGTGFSNAGKAADVKGSTPDEDDGSGMGWVKRRREARERAKAEEEAKAKAASTAETNLSDTADATAQPQASDPLAKNDAEAAAAGTHEPSANTDLSDAPSTTEEHLELNSSADDPSTPRVDPEHIARPHSSATIRNNDHAPAHPTHSRSSSLATPIPQIVVDDSHSSSTHAPVHSSRSPLPHAPHSHEQHTMEMAVVPPRPSVSRRSDSMHRIPKHGQAHLSMTSGEHSHAPLQSQSPGTHSSSHSKPSSGIAVHHSGEHGEASHERPGLEHTETEDREHGLDPDRASMSTLREQPNILAPSLDSDSGSGSRSSDRSTEDEDDDEDDRGRDEEGSGNDNEDDDDEDEDEDDVRISR
ncbi:hypothetical protein DL93DRAFT_2164289 [Clavulina sp. PMI_390]|nr:hypothetical protein DL93DRAFT_2164289 [Clavulina sp. PMI_390]